ncbi:MAG TPA: ParM/StbA family protein [Chitinophagaceae bacterium]|nr:ParM/StbA family protein [Chitinophagaceae bacterium]
MQINTVSFPSIFEPVFGNTENSANDLLNGIKIKNGNNWYIAGNLAKFDGFSPKRIINASPEETDYEILFKAAMVIASGRIKNPISVTVGFPFSTYNIYKTPTEDFLTKRNFLIEYDTQTFNYTGAVKKAMIELEKFEVIPEIVGGIIGIKNIFGGQLSAGNFIVISLGFGTLEGAMASKKGLIQRTVFSTYGLSYAVNNLNRELNKHYFLSMKNEFQLDDAMVNAHIVVNRKKIDLKPLRKEIIEQYYKSVISPAMRKYFADSDFETCENIYLIGGGANYEELVNCFKEEFRDILSVIVPNKPENTASIGYLYNTLRLTSGQPNQCIGLDLGNSSTVLATIE